MFLLVELRINKGQRSVLYISTVTSHYQEIRINRKFMKIIATLGLCTIQKCIVRMYGFQQKARPKMRTTNKKHQTWRKNTS